LRGVYELVENFDKDTYRVVYIAKLKSGVYVLHVFKKKSKKGASLPKPDMEVIMQRLKRAVQDDEERNRR
jgi:phage-related protein